MSINLKMPDITELKPRITVFGVGGAGCNAVNNMIEAGLQGVEFVVANTDAQALTNAKADRLIQMGVAVTQGLGAGSQPEIGRAAAEETIDEITDHLNGAHMAFITAGMGGGTGTGAAPIVARAAREAGILTVGVVTKPFQFEGQRRMRVAEAGILELQKHVDTLIVIPNQNLFRIANDKTTFADAFAMADEVLYSGVACITDLMVKDGLINLDFADVRSVMREMGKAMMGTGEASGDKRAIEAAEKAIANPLLDDVNMRGARGLLISITGGRDMTLFEVDEAASRVREEVEADANIIFGATFDEGLEGHHPRVGRGDRHRAGAGAGADRSADRRHGRTHPSSEVSRRAGADRCSAAAQALSHAQPQPQTQAHQQQPAPQPQPQRGGCPTMRSKGWSRSLPSIRRSSVCNSVRQSSPRPIGPLRSSVRPADPGVRIGPFRPDPSLIAARPSELEAEHARANEAARAHAAARTTFRPPPSGPIRCSRACRGWRIFRPLPSGSSRPAGATDARRGGAAAARAAGAARERARPARRGGSRITASARTRRAARCAGPAGRTHPSVTPAAEFSQGRSPGGWAKAPNAAGSLDPRGRPVPIDQDRDDHLEIPAFLRRQSS